MSALVTIPAMLDPHVHLRGMRWAHKGTFASETAAALAGGYWAVLDMPNTPPATVDGVALDRKKDELGAQAVCDWGAYLGARRDGEVPDASAAEGACGLKIYANRTTGDLLVDDPARRDLYYRGWPPGRPIAVHAEGDTVAELLELVRRRRVPTHFCHVSTAYEIGLLTDAKEAGLPVTVGVTPHHLFLTEDDVATLGALGRMKPELKSPADRDALWRAVDAGVVDVVESDHAPHTLDEKEGPEPAWGVPGLETTLPLLLTAVAEGRLTLERVVDLVARAPRAIFGLRAPPETFATVDPHDRHEIRRDELRTACGWSPFEGRTVIGRVRGVTIRGRLVYDGDRVTVPAGSGRDLFASDAGEG